jgi:enoyl-CoA hydratase/carnithine racemase
MAFLNIERDGGILTVTMNQPETRNALTGNTAVAEFVQLCADVRLDASVKVLILTGAGSIFSSGGNVKDMRRYFDDALTPDMIREEYRQGIQQIPNALYQLDVPVICAVNGPAIGAGLDLSCMCDIRIASEMPLLRRALFVWALFPVMAGPGCCRVWWGCRRPAKWLSRERRSAQARHWPVVW